MKIELKNIQFYERMSEETNAFTADIFVNGKNVGYAKNDGHGGCTWYGTNSVENRPIIDEAEKYCLGLPPIKYGSFEIEMNLENKIDQLFEDWLRAKEEAKLQKKLAKSMLSNLCVKTDNGYTELSWKMGSRKATIAELLSAPNGREALRNAIAKAKGEGKEVLNTNIPIELM